MRNVNFNPFDPLQESYDYARYQFLTHEMVFQQDADQYREWAIGEGKDEPYSAQFADKRDREIVEHFLIKPAYALNHLLRALPGVDDPNDMKRNLFFFSYLPGAVDPAWPFLPCIGGLLIEKLEQTDQNPAKLAAFLNSFLAPRSEEQLKAKFLQLEEKGIVDRSEMETVLSEASKRQIEAQVKEFWIKMLTAQKEVFGSFSAPETLVPALLISNGLQLSDEVKMSR